MTELFFLFFNKLSKARRKKAVTYFDEVLWKQLQVFNKLKDGTYNKSESKKYKHTIMTKFLFFFFNISSKSRKKKVINFFNMTIWKQLQELKELQASPDNKYESKRDKNIIMNKLFFFFFVTTGNLHGGRPSVASYKQVIKALQVERYNDKIDKKRFTKTQLHLIFKVVVAFSLYPFIKIYNKQLLNK